MLAGREIVIGLEKRFRSNRLVSLIRKVYETALKVYCTVEIFKHFSSESTVMAWTNFQPRKD